MVLPWPMRNKVVLAAHLDSKTTALMVRVRILRRGSRPGSDERGLIGRLHMIHVRYWHVALPMR